MERDGGKPLKVSTCNTPELHVRLKLGEISTSEIETVLSKDENSNLDHKRRNALFYAKTKDMIDKLVQLMDKYKCEGINHKDHVGETPFLYHSRKGNWEAAEALLDFPVTDVNAQDNIGSTVLHHLAKYTGELNDLFIRKILKRDALVMKLDINQQTALHVAASAGNCTLVALLAKSNVFNIQQKDKCGLTAFDLAANNDVRNILISCLQALGKHDGTEGTKSLNTLFEWRQRIQAIKEAPFQGPIEEMVKQEGLGYVPDTEENEELRNKIHDLVEYFKAGMEVVNPGLSFEWQESGSVCEGTKVNFPDEYDFIFIMKNFSGCNAHIAHAAYATLEKSNKMPNKMTHLFSDGKLVVNHFFRSFYSATEYLLCMPELWLVFSALYRREARDITDTKTTISALNLTWHGVYYPWLDIALDLVPAILPQCQNFTVVSENSSTEDIEMPICVAKDVRRVEDEYRCFLFQVSYNGKEHKLMKTLGKGKEVYKMCKIVRSPAFCKELCDDNNCKILISDHITSYMLKNVVFGLFASENNENIAADPEVNMNELLKDVIRVYEKLSKVLDEGHVPTYICEQKEYNIITQYWRKDSTPWETHLGYAQQYCSEILRRLNERQ